MPASPTNSLPLNVVRTGPRGNTPVVLLHSVGLDLTYWDHQIEALRHHYDVVALDLPGHGASPGTPQDWTLNQAAATIAKHIEALDAGPVHVLGLSVGGMIAQALTLTHSHLARSLVLIDTAARFTGEARTAMRDRAAAARAGGMPPVVASTLDRWFTPTTRVQRPDLIDRVSKTLLSDDAAVHAAMWDMIAELDLVEELPRISCPTLVLVGEHDPSSPPAAARTLTEHIPHATMHIAADASHMAPLEKPAEINQHILAFLDKLSASP